MHTTHARLSLVAVTVLGLAGCLVDDDSKEAAQGGTDTVVAVPIAVPVTDTVTITDTVTDTVNTVTPVPYPVPVPIDTGSGGRQRSGSDTGEAPIDTAR